jgi:hypothetical protein
VKYQALRTIAGVQKRLGWAAIACAGLALIPVLAGDWSPAVPALLGSGGLGSLTCGYVIDLLIDMQANAYATASNIAILIERQTKL